MKKQFVYIMAAMLAAAFSLSAYRAESAEEKSYTFGLSLQLSTEMDAQNKSIYTDIVDAFVKSRGVGINMKWYRESNEFLKDIDRGALDFFYTGSSELNFKYLKGEEFTPIAQPVIMNASGSTGCLYAVKASGYKSVSDLKNKKAILGGDILSYTQLRILLKEKPDDFFGPVTISPNGFSSIYSLALSEDSVAFVTDVEVAFLKMNNPGPVKKISQIACAEKIPFPPIMASKRVTAGIKDKLSSFLLNAGKEDSLKKFRPLMKTYKMDFRPVKKEQYDVLIRLYDKAIKNGWDKDYAYWIKTVRQEGK